MMILFREWSSRKKDAVAAFFIFILSSVTHLLYFGKPAGVVFDETYFMKFVGYYETGSYYFDIHPPLGKLIFLVFAHAIGVTPSIEIGNIGTALPPSLILLRLLPIFAGILLPVVVYYLCRRLKLSSLVSLVAGILICFENSLVVESRFVLMDSTLILCGFLFLLFYLVFNDRLRASRRAWPFLIISAIFLSCAASIKWSGLFFIPSVALLEFYRAFVDKTFPHLHLWQKLRSLITVVCVYGAIFSVTYLSAFAIHFSLLPLSGSGDAFMSPAFQKTLEGNMYATDDSIPPRRFFGKLFELNAAMYDANKTLVIPHPYSTKFYTWPLLKRGVYFWEGEHSTSSPAFGRIYLMGNPFVYWFSTLAVIGMLCYAGVLMVKRRAHHMKNEWTAAFILGAYFGNFIPFIFIGRVMFLYHYEAALVMSIIALAYLLDHISHKKVQIGVIVYLLLVCISTFIFFSPLTYGTPLSQESFNSRMWLRSWE